MVSFDKGQPAALANHFAKLPDIAPEHRELFWYDWGPVFYRGRLDRRSRLLGIASDPGPTERVVGRTLVGDAGQRVQGLLERLGLTSGYTLVNAFPVAVHPSDVPPGASAARPTPTSPALAQPVLRPRLRSRPAGDRHLRRQRPSRAGPVGNPPGRAGVQGLAPLEPLRQASLLAQWRAAVPELRAVVTPDPEGTVDGPNYGSQVRGSDYRPIPRGGPPVRRPGLDGRRLLGTALAAAAQQRRRATAHRSRAHPGVAGAEPSGLDS